MTSLQIEYVGTNYMMTELHLSRAEDGEDYYVDAVHLGRSATVLDNSMSHSSSSDSSSSSFLPVSTLPPYFFLIFFLFFFFLIHIHRKSFLKKFHFQ